MVKAVDPNALVLGPEEWGWSGYFYSGYDQQWSGAHNNYNRAQFPDRGANGGWDYMPWLLESNSSARHQHRRASARLFHAALLSAGEQRRWQRRSIPPPQLLRNRSTRQFWDTNYVDPSWINSVIMLIPRMKNWVDDVLSRHENRHHRIQLGRGSLISTARPRRRTFSAFSAAKDWIWPRAGPRPQPARPLTRR